MRIPGSDCRSTVVLNVVVQSTYVSRHPRLEQQDGLSLVSNVTEITKEGCRLAFVASFDRFSHGRSPPSPSASRCIIPTLGFCVCWFSEVPDPGDDRRIDPVRKATSRPTRESVDERKGTSPPLIGDVGHRPSVASDGRIKAVRRQPGDARGLQAIRLPSDTSTQTLRTSNRNRRLARIGPSTVLFCLLKFEDRHGSITPRPGENLFRNEDHTYR